MADIRKHFIFVSYKKDEKDLVEIERTITTKNGVEIPFVEIQTDNYGLVYDKLSEIIPGISPIKVRETRRVVKRIVDQNMESVDAESIIVGIDDLSNIDFSTKPLAIAIGYKENILNKYGYGLLEESQIFEDIIFDNKHFDAEAMCSERFKSIARTKLTPVFKYVKNQSIQEETKLAIYIKEHNSIDKIIANNVVKSLKNIAKFETYDEVKKQMMSENTCRRTAMTILKNLDKVSVDNLRDACKYLYDTYPKEYVNETNAKRCVLCLDFKENSSE